MGSRRPKKASPEWLIAARQDWRAKMLREFEPTATRLRAAYERIIRQLEPFRDDLVKRLVEMAERGEPIRAEDVRGMSQWQRLLTRLEIELNGFARLVDAETGLAVDGAVVLGRDAARGLTVLSVDDLLKPTIEGAWLQPDVEALRRLIGYAESDAYQDTIRQFGENGVEQFQDVLLSGIAQGYHPSFIARILENWLGIPFAWADNMARTAYLWSWRGASHASYKANGHLVQGWMWWSARDTRTCRGCWAMHGQIFSNDEVLNDHHKGRCSPLPIVYGATWIEDVDTGPEAFDLLPEADQRTILGPALFDVFKQGRLNWQDMSRPYQNDVYGEMLRQATIREILGGAA